MCILFQTRRSTNDEKASSVAKASKLEENPTESELREKLLKEKVLAMRRQSSGNTQTRPDAEKLKS